MKSYKCFNSGVMPYACLLCILPCILAYLYILEYSPIKANLSVQGEPAHCMCLIEYLTKHGLCINITILS